jgi:hypothetical protein
MRWRLLRRRLTISAPRMAVRSALPWPVRWLLGALVLGFSAALALWAFEFGKEIAGLERDAQRQLEQTRTELQAMSAEVARLRAEAGVSASLMTTERATQEQLLQQIRQLEADNRSLRSDLGLFERLLPAPAGDAMGIRGLRLERLADTQIQWQALLMQPAKNAREFQGTLEITLSGTDGAKPWSQTARLPQPIAIRQYLRVQGLIDVPAQSVIKTLTAKVLQGDKVLVTQVLRLI